MNDFKLPRVTIQNDSISSRDRPYSEPINMAFSQIGMVKLSNFLSKMSHIAIYLYSYEYITV